MITHCPKCNKLLNAYFSISFNCQHNKDKHSFTYYSSNHYHLIILASELNLDNHPLDYVQILRFEDQSSFSLFVVNMQSIQFNIPTFQVKDIWNVAQQMATKVSNIKAFL